MWPCPWYLLWKLTHKGARQDPGADPLPPLLPPPGLGAVKVVSLSSTMVPAMGTGLVRSQLQFPKHTGRPLGPLEGASVMRWIWHIPHTTAAVSGHSAGMMPGFPSELPPPSTPSSSSIHHHCSSGALGPGFALSPGERQGAGISPICASGVTCSW